VRHARLLGEVPDVGGHQRLRPGGDGGRKYVSVLRMAAELRLQDLESVNGRFGKGVAHGGYPTASAFTWYAELLGERPPRLGEDPFGPPGFEEPLFGEGEEEAGELLRDQNAGVQQDERRHLVVTNSSGTSGSRVSAKVSRPARRRSALDAMNLSRADRETRRCTPGCS
jgi:hypothetical protein